MLGQPALALSTCPSRSRSQVALLLFCINVPYNVIRQADHLVPCPLCHFGKALSFCLIFKCVGWKIYSWISDQHLQRLGCCNNFYAPDLWTSALTRILTPPTPSSSTSSSLLFRQSPIWAKYLRFVSNSL